MWTKENMISMESEASAVHSIVAYRYHKGFDDCSIFTIISAAILPCILSFCGLIGNTISMLVFWPDRHKSASSVLLLQLAVVDSLVLIIWSILCVAWVLEYFTDNPPTIVTELAPYKTKYGWATAILIQMISCWLIVYITVQRYVAVCHPHKMRMLGSVRVAWIQLAALVIFCVLFNIPHYMKVDIITLKNGEIRMVDSWLVTDPIFNLWYSLAYYLVSFIFPFALLIFFTTAATLQFRKSKMKVKIKPNLTRQCMTLTTISSQSSAVSGTTKVHRASENHPIQIQSSKQENITLSLIVVDIVFLICQPIHPIRSFTEYFLPPDKKECGTPYSYFESLTATGIFVNSSINFVIFCLCSKGFRRKVFQAICGRNQGVQPVGSNPTQQRKVASQGSSRK